MSIPARGKHGAYRRLRGIVGNVVEVSSPACIAVAIEFDGVCKVALSSAAVEVDAADSLIVSALIGLDKVVAAREA